MSRRRAREAAMQALFGLDMNPPSDEADGQRDALDAAWQEGSSKTGSEADLEYARGLLSGTRDNLSSIDEEIGGLSREWKLSRMSGIDRNILRLAVYELRFVSDVTPGIVINEAVELAKRFGTEKSSRFVNGILGAMVKV